MIVVDTNVIAYAVLPSVEQAMARRALARDPNWAAPYLWRSEFRNALALHMRHQRLTLVEAVGLTEQADVLLTGREYAVDSGHVLTLAAQSGRTAYDCEFVAVAQGLGVSLVTNDRQVLASFPSLTVSLAAFAGA